MSSSSDCSTERVRCQEKSQIDDKWKPKNERFAGIMCRARRQAQEEHATRELVKQARPVQKPTRAISKRQKSSKRSAEICREKMKNYIKLLEKELEMEEALLSKEKNDLLSLKQSNEALSAKITDLQSTVDQRELDPIPMDLISLPTESELIGNYGDTQSIVTNDGSNGEAFLDTSFDITTILQEPTSFSNFLEPVIEDSSFQEPPYPEHLPFVSNLNEFVYGYDSPLTEVSSDPYVPINALSPALSNVSR